MNYLVNQWCQENLTFYCCLFQAANTSFVHLWDKFLACNYFVFGLFFFFLPHAGSRKPWRQAQLWAAGCQTRLSSSGSCRRNRALAFSCWGRWHASSAHTSWQAPCASYFMTPSCSPSLRSWGKKFQEIKFFIWYYSMSDLWCATYLEAAVVNFNDKLLTFS